MIKLYGVAGFKDGEFVGWCKTGRGNTPAVYDTLGSAKRTMATRCKGFRYEYKILLLNPEKVLDI